jgi:hypothetical protein
MLHAYVQRFDATRNLLFFLKYFETKQDLVLISFSLGRRHRYTQPESRRRSHPYLRPGGAAIKIDRLFLRRIWLEVHFAPPWSVVLSTSLWSCDLSLFIRKMAMIRRFVNIVAETYRNGVYSLHRLEVSKHLSILPVNSPRTSRHWQWRWSTYQRRSQKKI